MKSKITLHYSNTLKITFLKHVCFQGIDNVSINFNILLGLSNLMVDVLK